MRREELRHLVPRLLLAAAAVTWFALGVADGEFFGKRDFRPDTAADSGTESPATVSVTSESPAVVPEPYVPGGTELAAVVRVVDGDTILVQPLASSLSTSALYGTGDSGPVYVRLSGIDAPESSAAEVAGYAASTPEGELAAEYVRGILGEGREVWLSMGGDEDTDGYGRLIRMVWLERPDGDSLTDAREIAGKTLNALLLREGLAEPLFMPGFMYEEVFSSIAADPYGGKTEG